MHEAVFQVAVVWLLVLAAVCLVLTARTRAAALRVLSVDLLTLILVAALLLYSIREGVPYFADTALVLALLSFAGTLAGARFLRRGRVFE